MEHEWELIGLDFSPLLPHCCKINLNVTEAVQELDLPTELCPDTRFWERL